MSRYLIIIIVLLFLGIYSSNAQQNSPSKKKSTEQIANNQSKLNKQSLILNHKKIKEFANPSKKKSSIKPKNIKQVEQTTPNKPLKEVKQKENVLIVLPSKKGEPKKKINPDKKE